MKSKWLWPSLLIEIFSFANTIAYLFRSLVTTPSNSNSVLIG